MRFLTSATSTTIGLRSGLTLPSADHSGTASTKTAIGISVRSAPVNSILYSVERVQDQTNKDQTRRTKKFPTSPPGSTCEKTHGFEVFRAIPGKHHLEAVPLRCAILANHKTTASTKAAHTQTLSSRFIAIRTSDFNFTV